MSPKITQQTSAISDDDYLVIEQALMQNPRGRGFLAEYIQRNRPEDTKKLLSAIQRIENNLVQPDNKSQQEDLDPIRMSIIEMAKAIAKTREEIKSIKPANEDDNHLINATEELSAIVESTENATNTILEAAEEIQEAAWVLREAGAQDEPCDKIDNKTTDIYTACSFQDITGQRTTKVVQALSYIENRVNAMIDIWGLNEFASDFAPKQDQSDVRPDAHLLNGPAKIGEGLEQTHVDDMLVAEKENESASIESGEKLADSLSFDSIETQDIDAQGEVVNPDEITFDKIETNNNEIESLNDQQDAVLDLEQNSISSTVSEKNPFEQAELEGPPNDLEGLAQEVTADQMDQFPITETSIDKAEQPFQNDSDDISFVEETLSSEINEIALSEELVTQEELVTENEQTLVQPNVNDLDLGDIEVTDLETVNEQEQNVSAINPLEESSLTEGDQELHLPNSEKEANEMLNTTTSEIETKITTQEEFDSLEELDPTTLTQEQKETLLS